MSESTDTVLEIRKRVFFFGTDAHLHCYVHQGKRGKWRWMVNDLNTGQTVAVSPVYGWDTEGEAEGAARTLFEAVGAELSKVGE